MMQIGIHMGYQNLRGESDMEFFRRETQLEAFVGYLKSGMLPFPFAETEELIGMVVAGRVSRDEGGREVLLEEII